MPTGFNSEAVYSGLRYHVQTEDLGPAKGEIVIQVYQGGQIVFAKHLPHALLPEGQRDAARLRDLALALHRRVIRLLAEGGLERLQAEVDPPEVSVIVNGQKQQLKKGTTLRELLDKLGVASERVAVERNRQIVKREDWASTTLSEGDKIEIVHFVGGGL